MLNLVDEILSVALGKEERREKLTPIEERVIAYEITGFGCPSGGSQLQEYQVRETYADLQESS